MASGRRVSGSGSRMLLGVPPSGSPWPPGLSGLPACLPFYVCGWRAACREEAAAHRDSSVGAVGQAQEGPRQAGWATALLRARGSPGEPWERRLRRGWLFSEGRRLQPVAAPALLPCVLSSTCLTWSGRGPPPGAAWTGACPAALRPPPSLGPAGLLSELGEQATGLSLLNGSLVTGVSAGGPLGLPICSSGLVSD